MKSTTFDEKTYRVRALQSYYETFEYANGRMFPGSDPEEFVETAVSELKKVAEHFLSQGKTVYYVQGLVAEGTNGNLVFLVGHWYDDVNELTSDNDAVYLSYVRKYDSEDKNLVLMC